MDSNSFGALFGRLCQRDLPEALSQAQVASMSLSKGKLALQVGLRPASILEKRDLFAVEKALCETLGLKTCQPPI